MTHLRRVAYIHPARATAWLDRLHSRRVVRPFSLRIQSHSISRAWLTFNRRRDSSRCRSPLFSPRAFRRRSWPNVPFDRVARTRDVTCASNMCPPLSFSRSFSFSPLSLSSLFLGERSFLVPPILISRGKSPRRHARTFSITRLARARADAVSHIRMLFFLVTPRRISVNADSPTLARVTHVPRH